MKFEDINLWPGFSDSSFSALSAKTFYGMITFVFFELLNLVNSMNYECVLVFLL